MKTIQEISNAYIRTIQPTAYNDREKLLTVEWDDGRSQILVLHESCLHDAFSDIDLTWLSKTKIDVIIDSSTKYITTIFLSRTWMSIYQYDQRRLRVIEDIYKILSEAENTFSQLQAEYLYKINDDDDVLANYGHVLTKLPHHLCRTIWLDAVQIVANIQNYAITIRDINMIEYALAVYRASMRNIVLDEHISDEDKALLEKEYYHYLTQAKHVSVADGLYTKEAFYDHVQKMINY